MSATLSLASRRRTAVLAIAAVAVALVGLLVLLAVRHHQAQQAALEQVEARFARLAGLGKAASALAGSQAQARLAVSRYAYPASQDTNAAGNDAQQRIRAALSAAKLEVLSSQVLPAKAEQGFERIGISVRAEGDLAALQTAALTMAAQTPYVSIDAMTVQGNAFARADAGRLVIQLTASVLRELP